MSLSLPSGSANAALAAKKEPQRKPPPRRSPRLAGLDRHPLAVPPTATASPTAASSNKRSIEDVHVNGSSAGGGGGSDHGGDPAAIPEAKAYSVTRSGKRSRQRDNGSVGQQVAAAATAAGAKSSTTRSSKRKSHGPDEESKSDSCQHQVITNAAATALGFHAATTGGFKKTSAATSSSINDESDKDSSGQPVVVAARPVVKTLTARTPSAKTSPDVDEESNTGSCNQEVLPSGGANASVAASFRERSESVAAPAVASASATSSGERRSSPRIDMGNDQEQIVAAAPAELAPTTSSGVRSSSQDSREKDNNKGEEVLEAAEEQALATSSRKRSIPDATKRPSNSTVTTDTTTVSPHMAILRQVQADLCEALYRCEELLGNMEEDLLRRQPNAMSVASVAQVNTRNLKVLSVLKKSMIYIPRAVAFHHSTPCVVGTPRPAAALSPRLTSCMRSCQIRGWSSS